jgi:hypothetical protein
MQVGGIHQKYQNAWRCLYSTIWKYCGFHHISINKWNFEENFLNWTYLYSLRKRFS